MRSALLICLLSMLLLPTSDVAAQGTDTFKASVDKTSLFLGETVTLQIDINIGKRQYSSLRTPRFRGVRTQKRTQQKLRESLFVGGKPQIRYIWRIKIILKPRKVGTFRSSTGKLRVGRQKYTTPPIVLTVRKGKPIPRIAANQLPDYIKAQGDVFLVPVLSPTRVYIDQQATISYYIFRRVNAHIDRPELPRLTDFWKEPLTPIHPLADWQTRDLQGRQYSYTLALRYAIFPMRAGTLKVDGLSFRTQRSYAAQNDPGKPVQSPTVTLEVLPLPPGGNDNEKVVGRYTIEAKFTQDRFRTKEPISLEVSIKGVGNLRQLSAPTLSFPSQSQIRIVSQRAETHLATKQGQVQGTRQFTYILHAEKPGQFEVPAIVFSFFDPWQRQHQALRTPPIPFRVLAGPKHLMAILKQRTRDAAPSPPRRVMALPALKTPGASSATGPGRSILWLLIPLPFLLLGGWFVLRKKAPPSDEEEPEESETDQLAYQQAIDALRQWQQHSQADPAALAQLDTTLTTLLQAWLTAPIHGLSRQQLLDRLHQHQAPGAFLQPLTILFQAIDQGRFSPIPTQHNIPAALQQLLQHIPPPRHQ